MRSAIALLLIFGLAACSGGDQFSDAEYQAENEEVSEYEVKGGETYSEYDERRDSYEGSRGSFAGYDCTEDCSGHEAGYQWAEENGIEDPEDCGGKSWSFEEGCRAYAEENGGY